MSDKKGVKGGWVPIHKNFKHCLPRDRKYTELEAMFSYTCDVDNDTVKSTRAYARIWQWSRRTVVAFINNSCAPERGHQSHHKRATGAPPLFFINKDLWGDLHQKRTTSAPPKSPDMHHDYNPNPNPNPKEEDISPQKVAAPKPNGLHLPAVDEIISIWNTAAEFSAVPKVQSVSDTRKKKIKQRMKVCRNQQDVENWMHNYRLACKKINTNSFMNGDNDRGWKATIDWLFANDDNMIKVLEGNYDR